MTTTHVIIPVVTVVYGVYDADGALLMTVSSHSYSKARDYVREHFGFRASIRDMNTQSAAA